MKLTKKQIFQKVQQPDSSFHSDVMPEIYYCHLKMITSHDIEMYLHYTTLKYFVPWKMFVKKYIDGYYVLTCLTFRMVKNITLICFNNQCH